MSEATDQSELKRKCVMEYNAILGDIELSHNEYQNDYLEKQKDKILRLAKILDEAKHPKEKICAKVCNDVKKYDIRERYVRKILPDLYKDLKHADKGTGPRAGSEIDNENQDLEEENKEKLLIATNGEVINNELKDIYNDGDTYESLKKQAAEEVREDKEETLENPNLISTNAPKPEIMISDKSEDLRTLEARVAELEEALKEQTAIAEQSTKKYSKILSEKIRNSDSVIQQQNMELKRQCNNYKTLLEDLNEHTKAELGYKEIEIAKLDKNSASFILSKSKDSEKTLVIFIHPKTGEVKQVLTDKEYHQLVARRDYQKELLAEVTPVKGVGE